MLSIIIPTYRRPTHLRRALESIFSEVIDDCVAVYVIDDDPEMSAAVVCLDFSGVVYYSKRGKSRGLSQSRNIGVKISTEPYLIFLDDDDYFCPGWYDIVKSSVNECNEGFLYFDFFYKQTEGLMRTSLDWVRWNDLLVCNRIPVGCYLINRNFCSQLFDETLRSHEDWDFLLRNKVSECWKYISFPLVVIDKTSTNSMQDRKRKFFWADFINIYSRFPAAHMASDRSAQLKLLGADISAERLDFNEDY